MLRFENVATPLDAAGDVVPDSVPPPAFGPMATATVLLAVVTRLPPASRTSTLTAGVIATPAVTSLGWTRKPNLAAGPTAIVNCEDVAPARPPDAAANR